MIALLCHLLISRMLAENLTKPKPSFIFRILWYSNVYILVQAKGTTSNWIISVRFSLNTIKCFSLFISDYVTMIDFTKQKRKLSTKLSWHHDLIFNLF